MYTIFGILAAIGALCFAIYNIMMTVVHYETERFRSYIDNKTTFYCKESPEITCVIDTVNWDDILNARMQLKVTYPSGNTCSLLTTTGAFDEIWKEI